MAATQKNRRTWETAFLLTASLDSGFKGAFEEAEQVMKDLRQQYAADSMSMAEQTEYYFDAAASALMASGVLEILGGIAQGYKACIDAAAEFEYTMSGVEAVALADAESMALLEEQAKELGATTKFTAVQSAEAMTYMAQAGWSTQEMLAGMPGVINLAAASGEDLAQSSSILADTLAGFQMEAAESARVADVLAQAAAASNTSVLEMGDTFKTSAALAGALGYSIEDVSAAVGLMANVGIKGSRAGTTLRNILGGFLDGVTLKGTAIGEVEFSAVNADGSMQSFAETIEYLRGIFAQMTEAEKISNARNIAGERGYTGLIGILEATDEAYNEMYQSIQNAEGAAQRMAEIRLDNLTGDVTILKSAFEGLEITIGEQFNPGAREAVQILTDIVNGVNNFAEECPGMVKAVGIATATIVSFAGAVTLAAAGAKVIPAVVAASSALMANPVGLAFAGAAAIIGGVTAAFIAYSGEANSAVKANRALIESHNSLNQEYYDSVKIAENQYDEYTRLIDQISALSEVENRTAAEKLLLTELVERLNTALPELGLSYDVITDSLSMATTSIHDYVTALYEKQVMEENAQRAADLLAQKQDYAAQISEMETKLREAQDEMARLQSIIDNDDSFWQVKNFAAQADQFAVGTEIYNLKKWLAELRAKMAQTMHEYDYTMAEMGGAATPAVEAEQAESDAITIINFNSDSTMTAEDYIRALRNAGTEVTEAMIATIEEQFGTGLRTGY